MASSTKKSSKRTHVTTACLACRSSKVKCDGATPTCSNCGHKGKECRYITGEDKRKYGYPLTLRFAIEILVDRVDQLSRFIGEKRLQAPPLPREKDIALTRVLEDVGLPQIKPTLEQHSTRSGQDSYSNVGSLPRTMSMDELELQDELHDISEKNAEPGLTELPGVDSQPAQPIAGHLNPDQDFASFPEDVSINVMSPSSRMGTSATLQEELRSDHPDGSEDFSSPVWTWNFLHGPVASQSATDEPSPADRLPSSPTDFLRPDNSNKTEILEGQGVDSEGIEQVVNELSDRVGSLQIGPDGQVRYFGPTSNFNLLEMPSSDGLTVHRTVRNDGPDYLERFGVNKPVPPDIEEHLIRLYFTWQDPSFHVVHKEMYEQARQRWIEMAEDTPYYSEALFNAMCALGAAFEARYHPTFITFPRSLADFFADRAKALLEIELDSPSIATVQAMVVLSGHDIGCKRDARGWLYSGMAMRLAFDMALHIDMTPYVTKGRITAAEAELRRTVFWGSYAVDHLWGFYLGRPFRINMEDVTVSKPDPALSNNSPLWCPYVSPQLKAPEPLIVDPTEELSRQRVLLCEIMAPLGYVLYGCSRIPKHTLQDLNEKTTNSLSSWKTCLPPALQVDLDDYTAPYLPHVLLLHMQYYQNIIHAHRPWMSKNYIQPHPARGPGYMHARTMCIDSAVSIAKLLHLYEMRYTLRRMNIQGVAITCSAALMLIFASLFRIQGDHNIPQQLGVCFRALDEFCPSWESARRARDFLVMLQRRWSKQARSGQTPSKRQGLLSDSHESRKKTRISTFSVGGSASSNHGVTPRSTTGPIDSEIGFDLDWVVTGEDPIVPGSWDNNIFSMPANSIFTGLDGQI